ncbi:MAG: DUF554 domain-containing protein [Peptococcaceae bacterium]|jgi:uncharacterized membrane protein YqgA involved in biofilm formation
MIATIINTLVVIVCALLGNRLKRGFPDKLRRQLVQILGICVMLIGLRMALDGDNDLIVVLSIAIGTVIGYLCHLERHVNNLGERMKALIHLEDDRFVEGFVSASLLFSIGAMSVVGSFEAGLHHNYDIILTKSVLDGVMSIVLGSTLGIGVAFSAVVVFAYQGLLTLLAGVLSPLLTELVIAYLSACGGVVIVAIGIDVSGLKAMNTTNTLPSLLVAMGFGLLLPILGLA